MHGYSVHWKVTTDYSKSDFAKLKTKSISYGRGIYILEQKVAQK